MDKLLNETIKLIAKGTIKSSLWFATSGGVFCGDLITDPDRALEKIMKIKRSKEEQYPSPNTNNDGDPVILLENARMMVLGNLVDIETAIINANHIAAWGFGSFNPKNAI